MFAWFVLLTSRSHTVFVDVQCTWHILEQRITDCLQIWYAQCTMNNVKCTMFITQRSIMDCCKFGLHDRCWPSNHPCCRIIQLPMRLQREPACKPRSYPSPKLQSVSRFVPTKNKSFSNLNNNRQWSADRRIILVAESSNCQSVCKHVLKEQAYRPRSYASWKLRSVGRFVPT